MKRQVTARLAVLAASFIGLSLALHSAIQHAQAAPKAVPMKRTHLKRVAIRPTALLFHTKSQAVADRIIRALKGAPGNYRIVSRKAGAKKDTVLVSHGKLSLRDVVMVRQAIAYAPGLGNQANVRDYVTIYSSVEQVLMQLTYTLTAVLTTVTSSTSSTNGDKGINSISSTTDTSSTSSTSSTTDTASTASTYVTSDTGGDTTGDTTGDHVNTDTNGDSGDSNGVSLNNVTGGGSGNFSKGDASSYYDRLQAALVGVDTRLYQMDIVDARALKQGRFVRAGMINGKGVYLNKKAPQANGIRGAGQQRQINESAP